MKVGGLVSVLVYFPLHSQNEMPQEMMKMSRVLFYFYFNILLIAIRVSSGLRVTLSSLFSKISIHSLSNFESALS
jgi:hypothetical protein